jgi:hypothetical protein
VTEFKQLPLVMAMVLVKHWVEHFNDSLAPIQ